MINKKVVIGACLCVLVLCGLPFVVNKNSDSLSPNNDSEAVIGKTAQKKLKSFPNGTKAKSVKQPKESVNVSKSEETIKQSNLYADLLSNSMPLSTIYEIADMSKEVQNAVKNIAENSNGIFMAKKVGNKLLLVTDNPDNLRHGVDFVEISLSNAHLTRTTLGYNGKMKDTDNDSWEYETIGETKVPLRHTKYNKDGDMEFIETWNYDETNPVKYEMKDDKGNVLSLKKETVASENDMRVEHLIYDKEGKTKVNVSATYEGADIKRFTYYNADKPAESGSVFSEYTDGQKTKETVYNSALKLQNTYTSEYKDGERTEIKVFDSGNQEIEKIVAE